VPLLVRESRRRPAFVVPDGSGRAAVGPRRRSAGVTIR
jgi:hypothetical protein